jgi:hypothetical protein
MDLTLSQFCRRVNALAGAVGASYSVATLHFYYLRGYSPEETARRLKYGRKELLTIPDDPV